jgi:hypothetical protein
MVSVRTEKGKARKIREDRVCPRLDSNGFNYANASPEC